MSTSAQPRRRLHLRVSSRAEAAIRAGHPWVYGDSVREVSHDGGAGDLAVVYDSKDRFLAVGLLDPLSPIRLRVLARGKPTVIDAAFWSARISEAVARRDQKVGHHTTGFRLVHGESDGLPGVVVDRYDSTLVLKIYTAAWLPHLDALVLAIESTLRPKALVLRMSRNCVSAAASGASAQGGQVAPVDGQVLLGVLRSDRVIFLESGLEFESEVVKGQKTGFFLDQRENRRRVETLASGKRVANTFSFSGGFSVYAARGQALSVLDVDVSAHALESGRRNFERNATRLGFSCHRSGVRADVFEWLQQGGGDLYDLIIVDPPSLAKREHERAEAIRAYHKLNLGAIRKLARGGTLVAASCSAHVASEEFFDSVTRACVVSTRRWRELERTLHPVDHPSGFPEAAYLKCIYIQFD